VNVKKLQGVGWYVGYFMVEVLKHTYIPAGIKIESMRYGDISLRLATIHSNG
jgi:hypothetical protein